MDYPKLSGATISERDKAFAQEFANFVNGTVCVHLNRLAGN